MGKISHFRQLDAWKEVHRLVLITYEGSLEELKYFFILSKDLAYISSNDDLMAQAETVGRLLNGLIASTERRQHLPS